MCYINKPGATWKVFSNKVNLDWVGMVYLSVPLQLTVKDYFASLKSGSKTLQFMSLLCKTRQRDQFSVSRRNLESKKMPPIKCDQQINSELTGGCVYSHKESAKQAAQSLIKLCLVLTINAAVMQQTVSQCYSS